MQLYIQLLFFIFNPLFTQLSKTNDSIIFNINNEKYYIGSYNEVYLIQNDSLIRVDKSIDSRVTINSYIFELNDTVIKYGGYGFWSQRNFMYYFDTSSHEWELYRINSKDNIEGSFYGYQNSNKESIIFFGGKKVNPFNRIEQIQSKEIVLFDFLNRTIKNIGSLNLNLTNKSFLCSTKNISFFYDDTHFFKIYPFSNKVYKYYKPSVINFIVNSVYNEGENSFKIDKVLNKTNEIETIILDGGFLNNPIEEFELYKSSSKPFLWLLSLPVLLITFFVIKKKLKKSKVYFEGINLFVNGEIYEFKSDDICIIKTLLLSNEMYLNDVMETYSNSELSYGHNTRITNENLDRLSIRLKSILKLKNPPIKKIKSERDRRQKLVVLTQEFIKINMMFK